MAILKSEFSQGNGRLREIDALTYDTSAQVLSIASGINLAIGNGGFSLNGASAITSVAVGTGSYSSLNDVMVTQGYVDEAVAGVVPGIPGDATYNDYAVASAVSFTAGSVMAFSPTSGLVLADANAAEIQRSNVVGVFLSKPNATTARVQKDGDVAVATSLAAFSRGDLVWLSDTAGAVTSYTALPSGANATQVGIVASAASNIVSLQARIFGEVG